MTIQKIDDLPSDNHTIVAEELNKNILFVAVSVHMWRGQFKIHNALVKLGKTELAKDVVTNPRWDLFPKVWREKFTAVEGRIKKVIEQTAVGADGVKFPIRGIHVIARKAAPKFFQDITIIEQQDFKPLVEEFSKRWPETVQMLKAGFEDEEAWVTAARHLPATSNDLAKRFWIERVVVPIRLDSNAEFDKLVGEEVEEFAEEIKQYGQQFTKNVAELVIKGLEDELKLAVDNLLERINDKGVIKSGTLGMVHTAFNKLQNFDFVMTDELKAKIVQAKKLMTENGPKDFNDDLKEGGTKITAQLVTYLKAVREQAATDAAIVRSFGRARRSIRT
jgi:hypothetical protein